MSGADWYSYRGQIGDRSQMFQCVADKWPLNKVLYLGSYVDISPSMVWRAVTYLDTDKRAKKFFEDHERVLGQLSGRKYEPEPPDIRFVHDDFNGYPELSPQSFDMVISLYSGPLVSAALPYLMAGGKLLVNNSHGDASLAILNPELQPAGCIKFREGQYRLVTENLDGYFSFKGTPPTQESVYSSGRGAALSKTSFALVFSFEPQGPEK